MESPLNRIQVTLMIIQVFGSVGFSEERFVKSSAGELPVSEVVDVLVVGGNEAGVAAAWQTAKAGIQLF